MAKKNNAPVVKVTHTQMICWSIKCNEDKRIEWLDRFGKARDIEDQAIQDYCMREIERIDAILDILRQMYKTETGTEYCG